MADFRLSEVDQKILDTVIAVGNSTERHTRYYEDHEDEIPPARLEGERGFEEVLPLFGERKPDDTPMMTFMMALSIARGSTRGVTRGLGLGMPTGRAAGLGNAALQSAGTAEQKAKWGSLFLAMSITEPGVGSDTKAIQTTARLDGNQYVLNGSKTFITNGQTANLIIVVCKTDATQGARGTSLLLVETDGAEGFERGRNLDKLGQEAADTSELFFNDVRVPTANLLGGDEGQGFFQLMNQLPQERLNIAVQGLATIERALALTIDYVKQRKAFGKSIIDFQNTQFELAECKTEATVARVFVNHCIEQHLKGRLDAATASMAKYWVTDLENKIIDRCLQLFGGFGYMAEYPIARMYRDSRVQRIYGGTNEVMKVLIARTL